MKVERNGCSIHGILPSSYVQDSSGDFWFVLSCTARGVLAVRAYSRGRSSPEQLSVRILNGEKYYRLIDDPSQRMPSIIDNRRSRDYLCPICALNLSSEIPSSVSAVVKEISSVLRSQAGLSGSTLIGASSPRDYDIVLFGIENPDEAVRLFGKLKLLHRLVELSSWRRFQSGGNALCFHLKPPRDPIPLDELPWPLPPGGSLREMFKVCGNESGFLYPSYYDCARVSSDGGSSVEERCTLISTRPGHSGLFKVGDNIMAKSYLYTINRFRVAVVDPCDSWADLGKWVEAENAGAAEQR